MEYTSIFYLLFIFLVMVFFYVVPGKIRWITILIGNVAFYLLASGWRAVLFLIFSAAATWLAAGHIYKIGIQADANTRIKSKKRQKRCLVLTLVGVLGLLAYSKYTYFITRSLGLFKNGDFSIEVIVPLGISFYTFMCISYLLDVYWKKYEPERNFLRYFTFVSFFPHIVQGPINRYNVISAQFRAENKFDFKQMTFGVERILWGLFQKLVIADRINIFVNTVFSEYQTTYGLMWVVTLSLYSVQTYADFKGCMDIASGTAELFGIKMEQNFDHPYFSKTIPEFWRRWHMTMGVFFKDYLFFPVSNSRFVKQTSKKLGNKFGPMARKNFITCFSVAVVWIATGVWHGAGWTFLLWGCYHGVLTIGGTLFGGKIQMLNKALRINTETFAWKLFQMIRTFWLCCLGRIFFRADSLKQADTIFGNLVRKTDIAKIVDGSLYGYGLDRPNFCLVIILIAIMWAVSMLQKKVCIREWFSSQNIVFRWAVLYIAIFSIVLFGIYGPGYNASSFIYGQF